MTKVGELITPTGVLVMPIEAMRGDHAAWLAARRERAAVPGRYCIGSSEVASILDLDGVDTPLHVYRNKVQHIDTPKGENVLWGSLLEATIADEWTRRNRCVTDEIGLVSRVDAPWHQSTVDRRVRECPVYKGSDKICLAEIKNVSQYSASRWREDLPDRILAQIVHQLFVTGVDHAHYAALIGGNKLHQGIVWAEKERDLMAYIVAEVDRFRTEHLIAGVEPAWDSSRKADKLIELDKAMFTDRTGELDIDGVDAVYAYAEAAAAESAAKKRKDIAKAELLRLAEGHEVVTFANELAYRFGTTTRTSVDLDRLKELHPDVYGDPAIVRTTTSHPIYLAKEYKHREERA